MSNILTELRTPFPEEDIEWRVQQQGLSKGLPWALVLAYVTNRAIMDRLDEIVAANDNNILGNYQNHDIVMKKGRYGLYVTWNGKNYSIKHLAKKKKITMKDVIPVFSKTNQNIIRILRDDLSIRKGKYGFYI